jgi:hypothetical protein
MGMEPEVPNPMRVHGEPESTAWDRFVKLQRMTSETSAWTFSQPRTAKGFRSFEEAEAWTLKHRRYHAPRPPAAKSPRSPGN